MHGRQTLLNRRNENLHNSLNRKLKKVVHLPRQTSVSSLFSKFKQFKQEATFIKALQSSVSGSIILKCYSLRNVTNVTLRTKTEQQKLSLTNISIRKEIYGVYYVNSELDRCNVKSGQVDVSVTINITKNSINPQHKST